MRREPGEGDESWFRRPTARRAASTPRSSRPGAGRRGRGVQHARVGLDDSPSALLLRDTEASPSGNNGEGRRGTASRASARRPVVTPYSTNSVTRSGCCVRRRRGRVCSPTNRRGRAIAPTSQLLAQALDVRDEVARRVAREVDVGSRARAPTAPTLIETARRGTRPDANSLRSPRARARSRRGHDSGLAAGAQAPNRRGRFADVQHAVSSGSTPDRGPSEPAPEPRGARCDAQWPTSSGSSYHCTRSPTFERSFHFRIFEHASQNSRTRFAWAMRVVDARRRDQVAVLPAPQVRRACRGSGDGPPPAPVLAHDLADPRQPDRPGSSPSGPRTPTAGGAGRARPSGSARRSGASSAAGRSRRGSAASGRSVAELQDVAHVQLVHDHVDAGRAVGRREVHLPVAVQHVEPLIAAGTPARRRTPITRASPTRPTRSPCPDRYGRGAGTRDRGRGPPGRRAASAGPRARSPPEPRRPIRRTRPVARASATNLPHPEGAAYPLTRDQGATGRRRRARPPRTGSQPASPRGSRMEAQRR